MSATSYKPLTVHNFGPSTMGGYACSCGAHWVEMTNREPQCPNNQPTEVYKPLTVVDDVTACSIETLVERIKQSREQNPELLQRYHDLWYSSGHTWHYTHFLGVGLMKCPNDLWIYQDLVARLKPSVIVETGTYQGGSALWFAFLLDMMRIKNAHVFTVDIQDYVKNNDTVMHPKITFLEGNSVDADIVNYVRQQVSEHEQRMFVLDSDHSAEHVRNELEAYAPMARVGDYVVVEDTNISWAAPEHHTRPCIDLPNAWQKALWSCSCGADWRGEENGCPNKKAEAKGIVGDRGARGGVEDYMLAHPGEFVQDILCERYLLTMNPGGWLMRVKACEHV